MPEAEGGAAPSAEELLTVHLLTSPRPLYPCPHSPAHPHSCLCRLPSLLSLLFSAYFSLSHLSSHEDLPWLSQKALSSLAS